MALKRIIKFYDTASGFTIEFLRLTKDKLPGFTHRVVVNGILVDYHSDHEKVTAKAAQFFLDKHRENPKCQRKT